MGVSLYADVSENTLPFESKSINNFSGIDISQSVDLERPSLSPHFLLTLTLSLAAYQFSRWESMFAHKGMFKATAFLTGQNEIAGTGI